MVKRALQWFLPREDKFFGMLNKQSDNVVKGSKVFKELIENYHQLTQQERQRLVKDIKEHENKGDNITHYLIETLNKSFITPFDKEDIHNITILLDDVIDLINTASLKLILYNVKKISPDMKKMTDLGHQSVLEVAKVVSHLKDIKNIKKHSVRVNTLENEADHLYHKMLGDLFNKNKNAIEVIKYKEIYDILEKITDKCEHMTHVFESLVVKHG